MWEQQHIVQPDINRQMQELRAELARISVLLDEIQAEHNVENIHYPTLLDKMRAKK